MEGVTTSIVDYFMKMTKYEENGAIILPPPPSSTRLYVGT